MARTPRGQPGWLILAFVLLWASCFALSIDTVVSGRRFSPIFVDGPTAHDPYPTVAGLRRYLGGTEPNVQAGDRVLRYGDADLRGVGPIHFLAVFAEQSGSGGNVLEIDRGGQRLRTRLEGVSPAMFGPLVAASVVFALAAVVLWLRAWSSAPARAFTLWFIVEAFFLVGNLLGGPLATYLSFTIHVVTMTLTGPLGLRALLLFPDGGEEPPRLPRWPWLFAVLGPLHSGHFGWPVPPRLGAPAAALVVAAILASATLVITRAYRRADAIGKRRTRWVCFGVYCAAMPPILAGVASAFDPWFTPIYFLSLASIACIPIAVLISMIRFNLFDIDRLISSTASYNLLILVIIAIAVMVAPVAAQGGADLFGVDQRIGQLALIIPVAVLLLSAQSRLQPRIEKMFFADRHALDVGFESLLAQLSGCRDAEILVRCMGEELFELLRPRALAVYGRFGDQFAPLFTQGRTVPVRFESDGPLTATLRQHHRPLVFDEYATQPTVALTPFERAVLETLDAAVVLPIHGTNELTMLLCLGPLRSGDVYTPVDLRLLATVADKARDQIERFQLAEVVEQSRRMQEALRHYVPGVVARALNDGRELAPAEREITVLFVDLRGFTSYCEPRSAGEAFATVDRYTEVVSATLLRFAGTLVEFNGDGMMAMFGAPEALGNKESAAIRAAREIAVEVAALPHVSPDATTLSVGVGIATGVAFVGNIHSADRLIWTAIGNTVNLAARLQALTRDLGALIAIDRTTYAAAGVAAAGFQMRAAVVVRGRGQPHDVFVLPFSD